MKKHLILMTMCLITSCSTKTPQKSEDINNMEYLDNLYYDGVDYLNSKDYGKGHGKLLLCASQGHGGCAEVLGWEFYSGEGTNIDLKATEKWLKVAWKSGTKFGYAGASGVLGLAELYCDHKEYSKNNDQIKQSVSHAKDLFVHYESLDSQVYLDDTWKGLLLRLKELENRVDTKSCDSLK